MLDTSDRKLPVGESLWCHVCGESFEVLPDHPGAHLGMGFEEVSFTDDHGETFFGSAPTWEWFVSCPHCEAQLSAGKVSPTAEECAAMAQGQITGGPPCARCAAPLAKDNALACSKCGFDWSRCPRCAADWESGSHLCTFCNTELRELV